MNSSQDQELCCGWLLIRPPILSLLYASNLLCMHKCRPHSLQSFQIVIALAFKLDTLLYQAANNQQLLVMQGWDLNSNWGWLASQNDDIEATDDIKHFLVSFHKLDAKDIAVKVYQQFYGGPLNWHTINKLHLLGSYVSLTWSIT